MSTVKKVMTWMLIAVLFIVAVSLFLALVYREPIQTDDNITVVREDELITVVVNGRSSTIIKIPTDRSKAIELCRSANGGPYICE